MQGINPTLHTAALAALEAGLNRALALDSASQQRLAALGDVILKLECTAPALDVYLQPQSNGLRLMGAFDGPVSTTVKGSASDFTQLAAAEDPAAALINGNLVLVGDSAPLLELQKIFSQLDMDWEAPLVNTLGDVAGHSLAETLRGIFSWGQQASASFTRQLEEFIHEEARLSPSRREVEDFYRDVQDLALRVERLQSRAAQLTRKLGQR